MEESKGIVYLVGAGPGDPGLLTLRGRFCLETAEVLVYDRLVADSLLAYAPEGTIRIDVGKEPGRHPVPQEEINRLLIQYAQSGKRVVRLKGGDPFVFGRGGEEALALKTAGIPFEIIPGVTSAIAVPAYAGIPVTHRGMATQLTILTGHEMEGNNSYETDWGTIGGKGRTLVILMGIGNLENIVAKLLESGLSGELPATIIENGTTAEQRTVEASLAKLVKTAKEAKINHPAIIVVGEVAGLAGRLNWFEPQRPLLGKRIMITRPVGQNLKLGELISLAGGQPLFYPTIKVSDHLSEDSETLNNIVKDSDWLIFTSINGVNGFFRRLANHGLDTRCLGGLKIAAIGNATAKALSGYGVKADFIPQRFTGFDLCNELAPLISGTKAALIRVNDAPRELADGLKQLGVQVGEFPVYQVETEKKHQKEIRKYLSEKRVDAVTFTSPSTVKGFLENIEGDLKLLEGVKIVVIGPVTANYAESLGIRADAVAANSGDREMVEELKRVLK